MGGEKGALELDNGDDCTAKKTETTELYTLKDEFYGMEIIVK